MRAPVGIRISSRRKALGLSQAHLARVVGISASYLNLIERSKREVGGTLLQRIARQLGMEIGELTGESEQRLLADIEEAFADPLLAAEGLAEGAARDLVARDPATARAVTRLHRAYLQASAEAEAQAARLRADPMFSQLLHQILSGVTALRSGSEILADVPDLAPAERERFAGTIRREAVTLSDVARNLIGQFDRASAEHRSSSPARELDDLIFSRNNYFAELETAAADLRAEVERHGAFGEASLAEFLRSRFSIEVERRVERQVDPFGFPGQYGFDAETRTLWFHASAFAATRQFQMVRLAAELAMPGALVAAASDPMLTGDESRRLANRAIGSYMAGAVILPYEQVLADAERERYDVEALCQIYTASFEQVAHRLVTLRRPGAEGVPFGFIRSDPAGRLTKHFPLPGLLLPNSGHACPLWALYAAFRTPDRLVRQVVRFSDGSRYLFIARTVSRRTARFADAAVPVSVMLAADAIHADRLVYGDGLDLADIGLDVPVGPSCRLCARTDCASRQEELMVPGGGRRAIRAPLVPRSFDRGPGG